MEEKEIDYDKITIQNDKKGSDSDYKWFTRLYNNENKFKPVVMITYPVKKDEIDSLIDILSNSDIVSSVPLHMPILVKG